MFPIALDDLRFLKRAVHDLPSRSDEWPTGDIFVIAWLFANQHHCHARWTFAKHCLCSAFV